ncbi:MAG TPA: YciI family protein [Bryobacterales bacterium]|nr:YciI family protein [Bryobacterales bacterium]
MRSLASVLSLALVIVLAAAAQQKPAPKMKLTTYYLALLRRGPAWTPAQTPEVKRLQEAHMANIQKMADEGKLVVAGPFGDNGELRGIFIFKVGSLAEAKALCAEDPMVKAGRLTIEVHPWLTDGDLTVTPRSPSQ